MSDTPETDNLARGNHVVPTEFAEQLERERNKARAKIITSLEWSEALADLENNFQAERKEARDVISKILLCLTEDMSNKFTTTQQYHKKIIEVVELIMDYECRTNPSKL